MKKEKKKENRQLNKKVIGTTDGNFYMSIEEVLVQYDDMVKSFAHKCVKGLANLETTHEYEDYYQMGQLELIKVFNSYDVNKACFSTILHRAQHHKFIMLIREFGTEKRKSEQPLFYLNKETDDGATENIIGEIDVRIENCEDSLEERIRKNFTTEERLMMALGFKKNSSKIEGREKSILNSTLRIVEDIDVGGDIRELNRSDVAKILNLSRPTLNKRIEKVMDRVKILALDYLGCDVQC